MTNLDSYNALSTAIKADETSDGIVLIKCGDFYETYKEDAHLLHDLTETTLTKRNDVPMSCFPATEIENYADQLAYHGFEVFTIEKHN